MNICTCTSCHRQFFFMICPSVASIFYPSPSMLKSFLLLDAVHVQCVIRKLNYLSPLEKVIPPNQHCGYWQAVHIICIVAACTLFDLRMNTSIHLIPTACPNISDIKKKKIITAAAYHWHSIILGYL